MHIPSGLVRDNYDPTVHNGVPIPVCWHKEAQHCADHGIPLISDSNACVPLRNWARHRMDVKEAIRDVDREVIDDMKFAGPVHFERFQKMRKEKNVAHAKQKKRLRKLQKKRGVR